jgi:hypothetical protein
MLTGTGTDQQMLVGYTGSVSAINSFVTLTTTWQRFSFTVTLANNVNEIGADFYYTPSGTAGANDYFEITGIQLEEGSTATPFSRTGGTIQGELAACQRYYFRNVSGSIYGSFGAGQATGTTSMLIPLQHPVTMRSITTSLDVGILAVLNATGSAISIANASISHAGTQNTWITVGVASGLVAGNSCTLTAANNVAAYIGLNAEL